MTIIYNTNNDNFWDMKISLTFIGAQGVSLDEVWPSWNIFAAVKMFPHALFGTSSPRGQNLVIFFSLFYDFVALKLQISSKIE